MNRRQARRARLRPPCTPVPGGLSFEEAAYLLETLAASGRRVIGFDLCEVAPSDRGDEWDANVGARILYKLCGCCLRSQGLC
jgi:agmatinase